MSFSAFLKGLRDSLSIAIGYVPVAISFGLAAVTLDLHPYWAIAFSVFMYAGASQFVLISLLAQAQSSWWVIAAILVVMNIRHLFYGPALWNAAQPIHRRQSFFWWSLGLTDEVFATAVSRFRYQATELKESWYFGLQVGAYSAWVGGTALGVFFAADWLGESLWLDKTLSFVFPALFFALLLDLTMNIPKSVLVATLIITVLAVMWLPAYVAIILGMIAGAVSKALYDRWGNAKECL